jgi:hypothetical protein
MIQEITAKAISWWTSGTMFAVRPVMQPFLQMLLKAVFGLDEGHSQDIGVTTSDQ